MRIKYNKPATKLTRFGRLKSGDCFRYNSGPILLKVSIFSKNAVNLKNGKGLCFSDEHMVERIAATVIVE